MSTYGLTVHFTDDGNVATIYRSHGGGLGSTHYHACSLSSLGRVLRLIQARSEYTYDYAVWTGANAAAPCIDFEWRE